ncbi:MAG: ribosome biogenesis GTP-binding protein YihA/YsxC [Patescibacteria group bacterium]
MVSQESFNLSVIFLKSVVDLAALPKDGKPQVALVGRSNVGKSSLINHLAGQKALARVSSSAGRTRTINLYQIEPKYYMVDMPGYGFAQASKEKQSEFGNLIADYLETTPNVALVLLVIDAKAGPTDLDQDMVDLLRNAKLPFVMIVNKVDKLSQSELVKLKRTLESDYSHIPHILHSMHEGKDRDHVLGAIHEALLDTKNSH